MRATWENARKKCLSLGGDLISITNEKENNHAKWLIRDQPSSRKSFWIGMNDKTSARKFQWSDGTPVGYTNWRQGEPSHSSENCVEYGRSDGKWNDLTCNTVMSFICKIKGK